MRGPQPLAWPGQARPVRRDTLHWCTRQAQIKINNNKNNNKKRQEYSIITTVPYDVQLAQQEEYLTPTNRPPTSRRDRQCKGGSSHDGIASTVSTALTASQPPNEATVCFLFFSLASLSSLQDSLFHGPVSPRPLFLPFQERRNRHADRPRFSLSCFLAHFSPR